MSKYNSEVGSIIERHYATHTGNRATSNEEFNRDAEYMIKVKELFLKADQRWRNDPTEFRRDVRDRVFLWAKNQSKKLAEKTWPKLKTLPDAENS